MVPQPQYSPDMSPSAFDLFPKLKKPLRGKCFRIIEEVTNEVNRVMRRISNTGVLTGIQEFPQTLDRCDKSQWRLHWRPVNVFCEINIVFKEKTYSVHNFWNDPRMYQTTRRYAREPRNVSYPRSKKKPIFNPIREDKLRPQTGS